MATYAELAEIRSDSGFGSLSQKVRVAVVIKAVALLQAATPTAAQVAWAKATLADPGGASESVLWYVIGANDSATVPQIVGATDSAVQTNVGTAVDALIAGAA